MLPGMSIKKNHILTNTMRARNTKDELPSRRYSEPLRKRNQAVDLLNAEVLNGKVQPNKPIGQVILRYALIAFVFLVHEERTQLRPFANETIERSHKLCLDSVVVAAICI